MADELRLDLPAALTGLTITAKLVSAHAVAATGIALTEVSGLAGSYRGDFPNGHGEDLYVARYIWGGVDRGITQDIPWSGSQEVTLLDAVDASSGSGANAVTPTVVNEDGGDPLQNATVTVTLNGNKIATTTTNSSGVASPALALDDGDYLVNITCQGFQGLANQSLTVPDDLTPEYELESITITASDPPEVTGYLYCLDQFGDPQPGVAHTLTLSNAPTSGTGVSYSQAPRTVMSAADGLVEFTGMLASSPHFIQRANGPRLKFTSGTDTFPIPDVAGSV